MIITDQAAYSDQIFGPFWLLGYQFSPRPAGLPDQRFWPWTATPTTDRWTVSLATAPTPT
jgi:TnpA family transposase